MDQAEARRHFEGEPSFDERLARAEIERELRGEYDEALRQRNLQERDRRVLALIISIAVALSFTAPLLALVFGFSWRVLAWAAGGSW